MLNPFSRKQTPGAISSSSQAGVHAVSRHRARLQVAATVVGLLAAITVAFALVGLFRGAARPLPVAVVMPLTGARAAEGEGIIGAIRLKFDAVNRAGGIKGRPLELLAYDDANDPAVAERVAREVAAGPAVAVIGHMTSETSTAAGVVYKEAGLPAITGTATADRLVVDNPYFYRLGFDDSAQGWSMATYTSRVLKSPRASILYSPDESGQSQQGSFRKAYPIVGGEVAQRWTYDPKASPEERKRVIGQVAQAVKDEQAGTLILAVSSPDLAREALVGLRRGGADPVIFANSEVGTIAFLDSIKEEPEERKEPGFFLRNTYAAVPVAFDTANDRMTAFVTEYRAAHGRAPRNRAARYYEVAMLVADALAGAGRPDRAGVQAQLAARVGPDHALSGLTGPLYFDERQTFPEAPRVCRFVKGGIHSAPVQIAAVRDPAVVDLEKELKAGNIFPFGVRYFWTQQVVSTGIDFRAVSGIDPATGTFSADFDLWFRYVGPDDVLDVDLNSAGEHPFDPKRSIAAKEVDGVKYRLYHVQGDFKADLDFHDYPFDSQTLQVTLTNPRMPRESVIYAIDAPGLRLPRKLGDTGGVLLPPSWHIADIRYAPETRRISSTRGDPGSFHAATETEFSGFKVAIDAERLPRDFLFKQLMPLMLLIIVVYLSLNFPQSMFTDRVTVAVTALLASSVIQSSMTAQLAGVGYTTAIEYGFYFFFLLCVFCIFVALGIARATAQGELATAHRIDLAGRWLYVVSIFATFGIYYYLFGGTSPG